MKDVFWDYISEPHLLIGGGTGGGKTVILMTIVLALSKIGFIDLCDPKNADLAGLKKAPVFKVKFVFIIIPYLILVKIKGSPKNSPVKDL